ncbi:alpha/beta fold hydrolase [Microbacterium sp. LWH3-1.2]|uniref:alpha/beta fold hydrolase n=1 Tax=Microbacterium sp. LWH3-1.2 TaxID=3135256 RepID=UPI00341413C7
MTDTTQIFDPDGRAIPYIVEGDGPIGLVLIAEPGQDALGVVGHYLAEEAGFHIIRVGYRANAEPAATGDQADDVVSIMDALGLERTWVGGHGRGGTVARALVAAHPERVNGLLLLGVEDEDIALAPVIPVLIVQGADDDVTPAVNGERLQATAPERVSVKTLDAAGHLFPLTHPVETAVIVEEYLDWD